MPRRERDRANQRSPRDVVLSGESAHSNGEVGEGMRWDAGDTIEALRSAWSSRTNADRQSEGPAAVFEVFERDDGNYQIDLPYVGQQPPAGTRLAVVGKSAEEAIARALREIECRGSGEFFRGF